jgi:hypothetical protein
LFVLGGGKVGLCCLAPGSREIIGGVEVRDEPIRRRATCANSSRCPVPWITAESPQKFNVSS